MVQPNFEKPFPLPGKAFCFLNKTCVSMELNKFSKELTQSDSQPASQAMLYALGLDENDLKTICWNLQHGV